MKKNVRIWRILLFDYYLKILFGKYISFINYIFSLILMFLIVSSINHIQFKSLNNNMNEWINNWWKKLKNLKNFLTWLLFKNTFDE